MAALGELPLARKAQTDALRLAAFGPADRDRAGATRRLPLNLRDRGEAVAATIRLAQADKEFKKRFAEGDAARDRKAWIDAEGAYWRALQLYPLHRGAWVQYAHCLKEQEKYVDADVSYRNAFALGDASADLLAHIRMVGERQGAEAPVEVENAIRAYWAERGAPRPLLHCPPTSLDIAFLCGLLFGRRTGGAPEAHKLMYTTTSIEQAFVYFINTPEFLDENKEFITLLAETPEGE